MESYNTISILGGTGDLGTGIAKKLIKANYQVIIGSRKLESAKNAALRLGSSVIGLTNREAAAKANIIILTVPFSYQEGVIKDCYKEIQGKIFVDTTVPLLPPKVGTVQLPEFDSAAVSAQYILGDNVRVVSAFQNVSAELLKSDDDIDCDVLVCGNSKDARQDIIELIEDIGMRGWHAGQLANSAASEALTSVLISINRHHKIQHSGIRITGLKSKK